jgi:pimeloyl-ACP methyl ester carboxylesterase
MKVKVNGQEAYFTTSGREIDQSQPTIVFVHGSGLTHVTWVLQTRYFAFHGFNTIAVDLPGHGDSEGPPLKTIEEMADWMASLLNVLEINKTSYVGHSQGCLVGLEFAYRYADKLDLLVLINGSLSMKMNSELLELALDKNHKAVDLMMDWVHGPLGQVGGHPVPGLSHIGMGNQLVSANNHGTLGIDFSACDQYENGERAALSITRPTLCIIGKHDRMTPKKVGIELSSKINNSQQVIIEDSGHMSILETASETKNLLKKFFKENS